MELNFETISGMLAWPALIAQTAAVIFFIEWASKWRPDRET